MFRSLASRLRGVLGVVILATAASLAAPALANDSLSSAALTRMNDSSAIVSALEESSDGRIPVIVEFSAPEVPALAAASAASGSAADDAALTAAVHSAQSSILGRVLELPDEGALSAAMESDTLNIKRMDFSPMFAITADAAMLERLAADPDVASIHLDAIADPMMRDTLPLIGMPDAYAEGATGNNWRVAVLDTGGMRSHEFLNRQIIEAACFSSNVGARGITSLCPGGAEQSTHISSADDCDRDTIYGCGHGTHVAGTAAGFNLNPDGTNPDSGVARSARIISINVFSQFPRDECGTLAAQYTGGCVRTFQSDQVRGLEHVYSLRNDMDIAAVNMSLGGGFFSSPCDTQPQQPIITQLRGAGIATVVAAGNDGSNSFIGAPACISSAVAVASSTKADERSWFSNWNSLIDVVAPGSGIVSSVVNANDAYEPYNGTSMASPHVAGAFTALRSAVPSATVDQIVDALKATGTPITVTGVTRGRINVDRALGELTGTSPTTTTLTGPTDISEGSSATFTATVSAADGGTPSGTVTFRRNGTTMGTQSLSSGTASYSTSSLPAGTHEITAEYGGSGSYDASTSSAWTVTVNGGGGETPTTTSLSGPSSSVFGETVTFSASVTSPSGTPDGTVTFSRGGTTIGSASLSSGSASITTSSLNMGLDSVIAAYGGTDTYASSSSSRSHTVSAASVSVSLSVPSGVVRPGSPARLVADVATVAPGGGTPLGSVRFRSNGAIVGTATLSSGRATLSTSLPAGDNSVTAHYLGTATHERGDSSARTVVVSAVMGSEITVNQRTRHDQQRPAISPLGRAAVVVYEDQLVADGPFGITAQRVNWAGEPNGDAIEVAPPAEGTAYPHVAEMSGGSFVVVWEAEGVGGRQDVFMRRFRANGRDIDGVPKRVNISTGGNQTAPRVAGLEDNSYAVVWQSDSADGDGDGIVMRIFEASGQPRTGEIVINRTTEGDQRGPDVAVQEGGDIVVSWAGPTGAGFGAYAQRVSDQGTRMGGEIFIGQSGSRFMPQVRITALDNGNFAVAQEISERLHQIGPFRVNVQRLRQRGPLWGDAVTMDRAMAGDQRTPAISGLRRMGLATAWRAPDGAMNGVWVQALGRDGSPISAPEMVNSTIPGNQFDPAVARVGTTRNFFVVWTASGVAPGDGTNIIIRRFMGP